MTHIEYTVRRILRAPRASLMRRIERKNPGRAWLEHFSYNRAIYAFLQARVVNPDLIFEFDLQSPGVCIDAGAFIGHWTAAMSRRYDTHVFAFEPNPRALHQLRPRFEACKTVQILEQGLGARDEKVTLTLQGPGSTAYGDNSAGHDTAIVEIRDVVAVLDELGLRRVDLLKLNIEGGEYDVLERLAETGWLSHVGVVLVQFHEWIPRAHQRRRELRRTLRRTHTQLWNYPWVWEAWQRQLPPRPVPPSDTESRRA